VHGSPASTTSVRCCACWDSSQCPSASPASRGMEQVERTRQIRDYKGKERDRRPGCGDSVSKWCSLLSECFSEAWVICVCVHVCVCVCVCVCECAAFAFTYKTWANVLHSYCVCVCVRVCVCVCVCVVNLCRS